MPCDSLKASRILITLAGGPLNGQTLYLAAHRPWLLLPYSPPRPIDEWPGDYSNDRGTYTILEYRRRPGTDVYEHRSGE